MTFANSPCVSSARPTIVHSLVKQFRKWRDRQRLAQAQRKLPELPAYLLGDVGLDHLRDLKTDANFPHRML
ncbi:hypothetical protein M3P21_19665 [Ruegeria sp. 2012CJ41-6]|uniref:DUF1127 domain-containing protein n=1 Tax=Ruegeria spongiae TaxID=2942209 RepID=A0ABT0Q794_9RHOB|nr:hypothetical protein [Ruegeria spongiae]MCL6285749.1 hypothetical protein [Ruegeria spongiae]